MDIKLVDLTVHIDENLSPEQRIDIQDSIRALDGVVSVHGSSKTPHLTVVEYNPEAMDSKRILKRITDQGAHAELIGL
jgi:cell division protein FtsX